ncbi:beta-ketothiolase BktB [Propionivibrio dicarboxylicus]|uniref:Acetyl-CoA C-acetyltransferase n=2 Tax=Propionivibrio dicarboxylicus TaxID=83767 RepID=A0A1G7ZU09_9RHOO|nr:beta-ketothiolase BktB [Propionivibrio dicarboxylicus]SDH12168.1 acetyl-CoA C-acetyltransferase [Propionivibrio dicarboxylicus]
MSKEVFALSAVRSPVGSFGGSLGGLAPEELGSLVAKEAFARAGVDPKQASYAVVGNVIPCGFSFPYVPRRVTIGAGMAMESTVMACNRLCGSAMQAIINVSQNILLGDAEIGLGGGVEVMSAGGYLSTAMRSGARMGDTTMVDMMVAVLTDPFGAGHMGMTAENQAAKWGISREEQDAFALESQVRAAKAIAEGRFKSQIVPVTLKTRKGEVVFDTDEHPRATTLEALAKMKPAFKKDGSVTAGNASGINDGAAFLVLAGDAAAGRSGQKPLARLVSYAVSGVEASLMGDGPIPSTQAALKRAGLTLDQIDVIEANEAFAAQAIAVGKGLGLDPVKTNPNGGAIALGHPVGATGAVIVTKLLHEMQRVNARYGLATMCIGGGQGITTIWERC